MVTKKHATVPFFVTPGKKHPNDYIYIAVLALVAVVAIVGLTTMLRSTALLFRNSTANTAGQAFQDTGALDDGVTFQACVQRATGSANEYLTEMAPLPTDLNSREPDAVRAWLKQRIDTCRSLFPTS
jgi:hypothetical protein